MANTPLLMDHPARSDSSGLWRTIRWFPSSTDAYLGRHAVRNYTAMQQFAYPESRKIPDSPPRERGNATQSVTAPVIGPVHGAAAVGRADPLSSRLNCSRAVSGQCRLPVRFDEPAFQSVGDNAIPKYYPRASAPARMPLRVLLTAQTPVPLSSYGMQNVAWL